MLKQDMPVLPLDAPPEFSAALAEARPLSGRLAAAGLIAVPCAAARGSS